MDRTIPFYNTILRCDEYRLQQIQMPDGYTIVPYKDGLEVDWARLECAVGDFSSVEEAIQYFMGKYPNWENDDDILFLLNDNSQIVGSCIAWVDVRQGSCVNSLHWLVVDEQYQGNGLGRILCYETMNRFYRKRQISVRKKARCQGSPGNGLKTIMHCRELERSRAAGTGQHPVEPDPSLVRRIRAMSGSGRGLNHSQKRSG